MTTSAHTLKYNTPFYSNNIEMLEPWIDVKKVESDASLEHEYEKLCQKHESNKKWILMIDPEMQSLRKAVRSQSDSSNVLLLNSAKVNVNMKAIETALCSGNCSAVVLCNSEFEQDQITHLNHCARQGKTKCILLNHSSSLH